ncbi:MAG: nuclear transport factor 2 family protein [Bryobacteraceae bacterium]
MKEIKEYFHSLEALLLQPSVRSDIQELSRLLSDDFVEFGSSGRVFDKQQVIALLQAQEDGTPSIRTLK